MRDTRVLLSRGNITNKSVAVQWRIDVFCEFIENENERIFWCFGTREHARVSTRTRVRTVNEWLSRRRWKCVWRCTRRRYRRLSCTQDRATNHIRASVAPSQVTLVFEYTLFVTDWVNFFFFYFISLFVQQVFHNISNRTYFNIFSRFFLFCDLIFL